MWELLEVEEKPKLEDAVLLVSLSTMVPQYAGLYSHGRELSKFLLKKLEFKRLATLYSSCLPAAVAVEESGICRLYSNQFDLFAGKKNIVMLSGDGSPFDDQQQYAHSVLSFAQELGVREVVSVGARWAENPAQGSALKPVGFATDASGVKELKGLGVEVTGGEPGPFFGNLVVGMAADYGMRGFKVGVDHGEPIPHPRSLVLIIRVLSEMLGFEVETRTLVARAREIEKEESSKELPSVRGSRDGIYG